MIDGVKIDIPPVCGRRWLDNNLLDFHTYINERTGEIKDSTRTVKYRGLTFIVTKSEAYKNRFYYSVRGSLHKYHTGGKTNATDFTIYDLWEVLNDLKRKFDINPETAILRNVEIGVNIITPIPAPDLINNLVALDNRPFSDFKINRVTVGKGIGFNEYQLKFYDKGKQDGTPFKNLVRFEIAVKRMRYLKKYGITTLADLVQLDKIKAVSGVLLGFWGDVIYYDKATKWREMSPFEQKKLLYYATPRNWGDFTRKQRYRAKKHFRALIEQYGTNENQENIGDLIAQKCHDLTAVKCPRFHPDFDKDDSRKMSALSPLVCTGKTYPNTQTQETIKRGQKANVNKGEKMTVENSTETKSKNTQKANILKPVKGRACVVCNTDISHKQAGALYCSKRCNNSKQAKRRKTKRHHRKNTETKILNKLLAGLRPFGSVETGGLGLLVEYADGQSTEGVTLDGDEINSGWDWNRRVIKVLVLATGEALTSYRAKTFINIISKINLLRDENKKEKKGGATIQ